ncbi:hypothetical protein PHLCEN_2v2679 [Hermanssonia centrifuga]|uniref:Uncharacterized protein n=1 Tax=Hermanssonia centrifuga TaxID=98765 RepID=A0A2R6RIK9_9APHY|nr:hypothetical protein PHLCEN_2v2679 [Hermanssonia centrifuga]
MLVKLERISLLCTRVHNLLIFSNKDSCLVRLKGLCRRGSKFKKYRQNVREGAEELEGEGFKVDVEDVKDFRAAA